jgi:hypothetical protein
MKVKAWASIAGEMWVRLRSQLVAGRSGSGDAILSYLRPLATLVEASHGVHSNLDAGQAFESAKRFVGDAVGVCGELVDLLECYLGEGAHQKTRSFTQIFDPDLRAIIVRDYRELSVSLFPAGAWKSAVVMAGSILEAILYDLLTIGPTLPEKAMACRYAPTKRGGVKNILNDAPEDTWTLNDLIKVAVELGILPPQRAATINQVLRDYRNFVHPRKERLAGHACKEGEAMSARGALEGVCDHLSM